MVREAESYAEGDRKRKEMIEARNEADSLAYSTEKSVQEHKVRLVWARGRVGQGGRSTLPVLCLRLVAVDAENTSSHSPQRPLNPTTNPTHSHHPTPQARLPQAVVDDINAALAAVREAAAGEDLALLRERIGALSNASMKIGESLAQQSGSSGSGGGDSSSSSGGSSGSSGPSS